jgi:hypothetical protein
MRAFRPHLGQVRPLTIGPALMALAAAARLRAAAGQTLATGPLGRPAVGRFVESPSRCVRIATVGGLMRREDRQAERRLAAVLRAPLAPHA